MGSCWIQIRERTHDGTKNAEEYVADILNLPEKMKVVSMIAIGYPDENKPPHEKEELLYEKVHSGIYGKPYYSAVV